MRTFSAGKLWLSRLGLLVGIFLTLYLLLLSNIVAFRHPARFDLTQEELHTLTPRTRDTLEMVQEEIRVVLPRFRQRDNPQWAAYSEVLDRTRALLTEYMALQPLIKMTAEIDVFTDGEKWRELRARYDLERTQVNRFLFFIGEGDEIRQSLTPQDLARFSPVEDARLERPEVVEFYGQKALTDVIRRLIVREKRPVYFTQDKQELNLLPVRPGLRPSVSGSANALRRELETAGYDTRPLSLSLVSEIPADCETLVIASPFQAFRPEELFIVDRYLLRGGRLLVALGRNQTGMETLLEDWGVGVKDGVIKVRRVAVHGWGESKQVVVRRHHAAHPITRVFSGSPFLMRMVGAHSLTPTGGPRRLRSISLLETSSSAQGESHLLVSQGSEEKVLEEKRDFSLAMAVEQEPPTANPPSGFQRLDTRIVVLAASDPLLDENFGRESHRDFVLNCFSWLTGEEHQATVGGSAWKQRTLDIDGDFMVYLKYVPTLVFPGIFLCLGAFVYYLRRV